RLNGSPPPPAAEVGRSPADAVGCGMPTTYFVLRRPTMRGVVLLLSAIGFLIAGRSLKGQEGKSDLDRLQGTWIVTKTEVGEKEIASKSTMRWIVKGDKVTNIQGKDERVNEGTLKLDSTNKPKQIDILITYSTMEENKGTTVKGIYYLEGDTLKLGLGT